LLFFHCLRFYFRYALVIINYISSIPAVTNTLAPKFIIDYPLVSYVKKSYTVFELYKFFIIFSAPRKSGNITPVAVLYYPLK